LNSYGDDPQAGVVNINYSYGNTMKMKIGVHHSQFVITKVDNIFRTFYCLISHHIVMFYYLGENNFHIRIFAMELRKIIYPLGEKVLQRTSA